jgi:glucosamine-6-phosphate deaminase
VGIGENGHLAFNDPPADFKIQDPYVVVELNEACRKQQVGEGWFSSVDEVPTHAISMSIQQILKARNVLCVVPDQRKAEAVRNCLGLEVSPLRPASILQQHRAATIYLDQASASLLSNLYLRN